MKLVELLVHIHTLKSSIAAQITTLVETARVLPAPEVDVIACEEEDKKPEGLRRRSSIGLFENNEAKSIAVTPHAGLGLGL